MVWVTSQLSIDDIHFGICLVTRFHDDSAADHRITTLISTNKLENETYDLNHILSMYILVILVTYLDIC